MVLGSLTSQVIVQGCCNDYNADILTVLGCLLTVSVEPFLACNARFCFAQFVAPHTTTMHQMVNLVCDVR